MKILIKRFITAFKKVVYAKKCKISLNSLVRGCCKFEGSNCVGNKSIFYSSELGYGSYIGNECVFVNVKIERFCSIGNNVKVIAATHPLNNVVSTSPLFYSKSRSNSFVTENKYTETLLTNKGYQCEIGHDVWIGDNVLIKGGTKIGNGAVIAMGAVITKDVPPYAIVGGVPAKTIRYRFTPQEIAKLDCVKWYERDINWIKLHAHSFMNFEEFINEVENENL